jgi:hypothetical protein
MKKSRGADRMKRGDESGFALLLVFVMAAAISITLYMEVPRMAFESQRAKEQMAIDRGLQYKRAIQLFYRKYQLYPQTLDDLETSRNIRFLRRRYLDPLTGKEWRLLHVGPAGQLTDSLVQPPAPLPGSTTGNSLNPAQGSSQTSAFSQGSNTSQAANQQAQAVDPNNPNDPNAQQAPDPLNMAARRPSDRIIGRGAGAAFAPPVPEPESEPAEQNPPPQPEPEQPQQPEPAPVETGQQPTDPNAPDPTQEPENPAQPQPTPQPIPGLPTGVQPPGQPNGQPPGQPVVQFPPGIAPPPGGTPGQPAPNTPATPFPQQGPQAGQPQIPGQPATPANGAPPQTAANLIQNLLTTPRQPPSSLGGGFTTGNTGGIAGVASTAEGKGIHVVNDHAKYKEWEFVYDLKKDKSIVGAAGANQQQQLQQQMQQNQNGALGASSSPFSSTPGSSPAASNPAAPAAPTTPPPNQ